MKTVTLLPFLCVFLALSRAAPASPDTAGEPQEPVPEGELSLVPEGEGGVLGEAAVVEPEEEETFPDAENDLVMNRNACPWGWSQFGGRCFQFFKTARTWVQAEKDCLTMQANLASVHSYNEYYHIQRVIQGSAGSNVEVWIGGTDAQQNNVWLWSDGSPVFFVNWCSGQPNNSGNNQHCVTMNYEGSCWNDLACSTTKPYVCAKKL